MIEVQQSLPPREFCPVTIKITDSRSFRAMRWAIEQSARSTRPTSTYNEPLWALVNELQGLSV